MYCTSRVIYWLLGGSQWLQGVFSTESLIYSKMLNDAWDKLLNSPQQFKEWEKAQIEEIEKEANNVVYS